MSPPLTRGAACEKRRTSMSTRISGDRQCLVCDGFLDPTKRRTAIYCSELCRGRARTRRRRGQPVGDVARRSDAVDGWAIERETMRREALRLDVENQKLRREAATATRQLAASLERQKKWVAAATATRRKLETELLDRQSQFAVAIAVADEERQAAADRLLRQRQYFERQLAEAAKVNGSVPGTATLAAPATGNNWRGTGISQDRVFSLFITAGTYVRQRVTARDWQSVAEWEEEIIRAVHQYKTSQKAAKR